MANITVYRPQPSGITMCARNTLSRTAPSRAIAAGEYSLRASVFNRTRLHPSRSNANYGSSNFAAV